jgi:hypothetical protein
MVFIIVLFNMLPYFALCRLGVVYLRAYAVTKLFHRDEEGYKN